MVTRSRAIVARVPDRSIVTCLTILSLNALLSIALLAGSGGDVSRLVEAGQRFTDPSLTPPSLTITSRFGFDGQFYYRLANQPFSTATFVEGVRFDIPALRAQRVFYPVLGWVGSLGGHAALVPWALLFVNLGAVALVGWLSGALAQASGRHAAWGLLIAFYPGFVYSLSFDLTEIVATACMLAGLLFLRRGRYRLAAGALVLAVLTRETAVLVPLGLLLAWAWGRWRHVTSTQRAADDRAALSGLVALVAFFLWQGWLWHVWGSIPLTASTQENVRVPLQGLVRSLATFEPKGGRALFRIASAGLLLGIGVLAVWRWRRSNAPYSERFAFLLALIVVLIQSENSWADATSFLRVGTEYWVLGVLTVLGVQKAETLDLLPAFAFVFWLVIAVGRVAALTRAG
jgi:Glycosyltransferase family 87